MVQSYRFTIFCPDLVDITKAPTYRIQKEPGNDDTCILHFRIGPPYEDLAFRIVNKEWEYSHKKGFKSTFDRGVLQLHFNFKWVPACCRSWEEKLIDSSLASRTTGVPSIGSRSGRSRAMSCTLVFLMAYWTVSQCKPMARQPASLLYASARPNE